MIGQRAPVDKVAAQLIDLAIGLLAAGSGCRGRHHDGNFLWLAELLLLLLAVLVSLLPLLLLKVLMLELLLIVLD